jgi:hypothetical protein
MADGAVKTFEKVGIERDADSAENAHAHSCGCRETLQGKVQSSTIVEILLLVFGAGGF